MAEPSLLDKFLGFGRSVLDYSLAKTQTQAQLASETGAAERQANLERLEQQAVITQHQAQIASTQMPPWVIPAAALSIAGLMLVKVVGK